MYNTKLVVRLLIVAILLQITAIGFTAYQYSQLTKPQQHKSLLQAYDNAYGSNTNLLRSYQIQIESEDSISLYDSERLVGTIPFNHLYNGITPLDSLIMADNE